MIACLEQNANIPTPPQNVIAWLDVEVFKSAGQAKEKFDRVFVV
jgi:hypothetical protein